jgi:dienelactone hydrolase
VFASKTRSIAASIVAGLNPSRAAWRGAAVALYALWAFMVLWALRDLLAHFSWGNFLGLIAFYAYLGLFGALLLAVVWWGGWLQPPYRFAFFLVLPVAGLFMALTWGAGAALALLVLLGGMSTFFGALASLLAARAWRAGTVTWLLIGAGMLALGLHAFVAQAEDPNPALAAYHLRGHTLALPDPGQPGPHPVESFTYGSGVDLRRPEYRGAVRVKTLSVDGSKLDTQWTGLSGQLRTRYWGFDAAHMPLQARVWMPQGPGPFPLVLIVHGNHAMEEPSEAGYAYLGEHLASQGFILVSVDENFLNSAASDQLTDPLQFQNWKELPARAWLLLEHLRQWRSWTQDAGSPLQGKADMEHIALIGHSRGGEAVVVANLFNDLDFFPDDATMRFDFHFRLRGIAAIAPTDATYQPRSSDPPMRDQNYLVMAGSLDGDNGSSFLGSAQYSRLRLSGPGDAFKASLYIKDANHGQFNTTWGRNDSGTAYRFLFDERGIMAGPAQRQIAKVYLTAFLDIVLKGADGYRALLQDARNGAGWLPDDFMVNNYADAGTRWLANYEEDADPGTGSDPIVTLTGSGLTVWREGDVDLKFSRLGTHVAFLAWDDRVRGPTASYRIAFRHPPEVSPDTDLVFGAAQAEIDTLPLPASAPGDRRNEDRSPLDWTIRVSDTQGRQATVPLSHDQALYPQVRADPHRAGISGGPRSEIVMRRYCFALRDFAALNPQLDLQHLSEIDFVFDRTPRGAIALDDVGLATEPR